MPHVIDKIDPKLCHTSTCFLMLLSKCTWFCYCCQTSTWFCYCCQTSTWFCCCCQSPHVVVDVKVHMLLLMSKSTCCCYCFCLSSVMTVMAPHCVHTSGFVFCLKIRLPVCPLAIVGLLKKVSFVVYRQTLDDRVVRYEKENLAFDEQRRQNKARLGEGK